MWEHFLAKLWSCSLVDSKFFNRLESCITLVTWVSAAVVIIEVIVFLHLII